MHRPNPRPDDERTAAASAMRPMRILHVVPWLAARYGGSAAAAADSARWVARRGHRVEMVATNLDGPGTLDVALGRPIEWQGLRTTFHAASFPKRFIASRAMTADLVGRTGRFDVVHIHTVYRYPTVAAAAAARARGVPYVVQVHGALDPWHRAQRRRPKDVYHRLVLDRIIEGAAAVVCTSRQEAEAVRDLGYRVPTSVIPIGIEALDLRRPASADAAARPLPHAGGRVVTFLGRIAPKKGLDLLVEAFADTARAFPDARLVVAGPDDEGIAAALAPRIAELGLAARITIAGTVVGEEKRALLQRSDVFVLPSADESFGIAVAEAMAVGCPVVITPHVAMADTVLEFGAGRVVARDAGAVADAVAAILSDPDAARAMGAAGRRAVDERLAWPGIAAQLEALYAAVVEGEPGATRRRGPRSRRAGSP